MDQIRHVVPFDGVEDNARRLHIVADEGLGLQVADLGLQHHDSGGAGQMARPISDFSEVRILANDIRMQFAKDSEIAGVLVQDHQLREATRLQAHDEILSHEARPTGQDDLCGALHLQPLFHFRDKPEKQGILARLALSAFVGAFH